MGKEKQRKSLLVAAFSLEVEPTTELQGARRSECGDVAEVAAGRSDG
jgi:hypothetical protein